MSIKNNDVTAFRGVVHMSLTDVLSWAGLTALGGAALVNVKPVRAGGVAVGTAVGFFGGFLFALQNSLNRLRVQE